MQFISISYRVGYSSLSAAYRSNYNVRALHHRDGHEVHEQCSPNLIDARTLLLWLVCACMCVCVRVCV